MCDCYWHKCEECEALIPWHIGDYNYPREDFRAWCPVHESIAPESAVRFKVASSEYTKVEAEGVWALTGPSWDDNHPNCDYEEAVEAKMGEPERRTVEILIDGQVVRTMGCTVSRQMDGEVTWLASLKFDEPVNVQDGEEFSYRFVAGGAAPASGDDCLIHGALPYDGGSSGALLCNVVEEPDA